MSIINKINDWIAVKLTLSMSTIWCVYGFFVLSIIPLLDSKLETICMYISSTVIQLVALPVILVGQNLLSRSSEQRAIEDHESIVEILNEVKSLLKEENKEDSDIVDLKNEIAELRKTLNVMR